MHAKIEIGPHPANLRLGKVACHENATMASMPGAPVQTLLIRRGMGKPTADQDTDDIRLRSQDNLQSIDYILMRFQPSVLTEVPLGGVDEVRITNYPRPFRNSEPDPQFSSPVETVILQVRTVVAQV
jgi:hypothetical protein